MSIPLAPIILLIPLLIFALVVIVIVAFARFLFRLASGGDDPRRERPEDTREIQQMHANLSRIEERLEALETILLERQRQYDQKA
ncbi:phage-shock protein [bacterium]|nr:phage-shock protein [bacterium]